MVKFHNRIFRNKYYLELSSRIIIIFTAFLAIAATLFLVGFIVYKSIFVFSHYGFLNFMFTKIWRPENNDFGAFNFIIATLLLVFLATLIVIPLAIFTAVLISEFLGKRMKKIIIFFIETLAGTPPVILGIFGLEVVGNFYQKLGATSPTNLLTATTILVLMALPTTVTLIYNALSSVNSSYRFASLAMGVSRTKTAFSVIKKSVRAKIIGAIAFGMCRVIGEVTAMIMLSGLVYKLPNFQSGFLGFLFSGVTTLATVIGIELSESSTIIHNSALFALGLILIFFVSFLNIVMLFTSKAEYRNRSKNKWSKKWCLFRNQTNFKNRKPLFKGRRLQWYQTLQINNVKFNQQISKIKDVIYLVLMWLAMSFLLIMTLSIIGDVFIKGIRSIMFLNQYRTVIDKTYHLAPLLVSTLLLIIVSLIISVPLGLCAGIYLSEYTAKNSQIAKFMRFMIDILVATPAIVFGMFGYLVFVNLLQIGHNFISAGLMFAIITLPIIVKTTEDALSGVPNDYRDSSLALGATKIGTIFKVILPNCKSGIVTGIVLAISKIISETMPALLTLSSSPFMPRGLFDPGSTLTVKIYQVINEPDIVASIAAFIKIEVYDLAKIIAYEIAIVTISLIILLNLLIKYLTREQTKSNKFYVNLKGVWWWLKKRNRTL